MTRLSLVLRVIPPAVVACLAGVCKWCRTLSASTANAFTKGDLIMLKMLPVAVILFAGGLPASLAQADPQEKPEPAAKTGPAKPQAAEKELAKPSAEETKQAASGRVSSEAAIEKALEEKAACEFVETPLADVADFLRDRYRINIMLDKKALDGTKVDASATVTMSVKDVSLRSALELLLRPLKLTWTIHDEVLLITTPEEAGKMLTTKVYQVADLVAPPPDEMEEGEAPAPAPKDFEALSELITSTIAPETWDTGGGHGTIAVAAVGGRRVLVVSQTYQVHDRVGRLLDELRKAAAEKPKAAAAEKPKAKAEAHPKPGHKEGAKPEEKPEEKTGPAQPKIES